MGKAVHDFHLKKDSLPSGENHFAIFMPGHRKVANILTELIVSNLELKVENLNDKQIHRYYSKL